QNFARGTYSTPQDGHAGILGSTIARSEESGNPQLRQNLALVMLLNPHLHCIALHLHGEVARSVRQALRRPLCTTIRREGSRQARGSLRLLGLIRPTLVNSARNIRTNRADRRDPESHLADKTR